VLGPVGDNLLPRGDTGQGGPPQRLFYPLFGMNGDRKPEYQSLLGNSEDLKREEDSSPREEKGELLYISFL